METTETSSIPRSSEHRTNDVVTLRETTQNSWWAINRKRRVSTTLRQVLAKFNEFFICWVFRKEISRPGLPSNDDRQRGLPTASPLFVVHVPPPIGSDSAVAAGLLIQTALGRTGGLGALRTKRSG